MGRVLSIDDDPLTQTFLGKVVEKGGHEFQACRNPGEALGLAREWQPNIILLDMMMNDTDGPTVLAEIRAIKELEKSRVVIVSSLDRQDVILPLLKNGAHGYCSKLRVTDKLNAVIEQVLAGQKAAAFPEAEAPGDKKSTATPPDANAPVFSVQDGTAVLELHGALSGKIERQVFALPEFGSLFTRDLIIDITGCNAIEHEGVKYLAKIIATARGRRKQVVLVAQGEQGARLRDEGLGITADIVYDRADALRFLK